MKVIILTILVLGVSWYFFGGHVDAWMRQVARRKLLDSLFPLFEQSVAPDGTRWRPVDFDADRDLCSSYVLSVYDEKLCEVVYFPVLRFRLLVRWFFAPSHVYVQIGSSRFELVITSKDRLKISKDEWIVSLSGKSVESILGLIDKNRYDVTITVVGGDSRRIFPLCLEEVDSLCRSLELCRALRM